MRHGLYVYLSSYRRLPPLALTRALAARSVGAVAVSLLIGRMRMEFEIRQFFMLPAAACVVVVAYVLLQDSC